MLEEDDAMQRTPEISRMPGASEDEEMQAMPMGEEDKTVATMPEISRMPESELEEDVQAKAHGGAFEAKGETQDGIESLDAQSGEKLPDSERQFFESRMGRDFSDVKIHTDGKAAGLSQSINAKAFTYGKNVAFNQGEYRPGDPEGRKLIAHELTHVVQQGKAGMQRQVMREPTPGENQQDRQGDEDTERKKIEDFDLHKAWGIYYNIRFRYKSWSEGLGWFWDYKDGWLLDAGQLKDVVESLDEDSRITYVEVSAHHTKTGIFYGDRSKGELTDSEFAGLFSAANVARGAHFQMEACNTQTLRSHPQSAVGGLGVTWTYTVGTNTDIPLVPWDISEEMMQEHERKEGGDPGSLGDEYTEALDGEASKEEQNTDQQASQEQKSSNAQATPGENLQELR